MTQERELEQHEEEHEHEIHEQHEEEALVDSEAAGGSASETRTTSKKWKARSQTTWLTDVMNAGEVNEDRQPLDQCRLMRLSRVCGLAARQRVPLTLEKFEDVTEDEKNELFVNSIQRFVTCLRKEQNPFKKFKDLEEEDCERFVAKCESPEFVANSEYMQQLWAQNDLNHHLDNTGYAENRASGNRRIRDWPSKVPRIHMINSKEG
jgi:hypothetical protein